MKNYIYFLISILFLSGGCTSKKTSPLINRKALVERHNIYNSAIDTVVIPQVGNGEIAFGIDVTGLQTLYGNTLAQWGWHTAPLPAGKTINDFKMTEVKVHGHLATYPVEKKGQEEMYTWLRENPHRLNLGRLSFFLDDRRVEKKEISEVNQQLDLWRGVITSHYSLDGIPVEVITTCHPKKDAIAVAVKSSLVSEKRLSVVLDFPYGHATVHSGADWEQPDQHTTKYSKGENQVLFNRTLDQDTYQSLWKWEQTADFSQISKHGFQLTCKSGEDIFYFSCEFADGLLSEKVIKFEETLEAAEANWKKFWGSGGAIDLSESSDPRWKELERRIVLSQYLLAVNEAGSLPPQESGLLLNSGWYGKFHLEMHWWHGAHYQLWDRWELFDRSLGWYQEILPEARKIANRQGYVGARWPKMIGPDGRYGPSLVGPWLIWQQPHPIFYAEQNYRNDPDPATLEKWKEVIFETADFMADYAYENEETGYYDLGPWVINAAENNRDTKDSTLNPAFELAYWKYGLKIASRWRERLGMPPNQLWKKVLENLAPLPVEEEVYVMYENVPDMWNKFNRSHIDVIGTGAFLPTEGIDTIILKNTLDKVWRDWRMTSTWGWDFPWLAMAAARMGQSNRAVDALLMDISKNAYSKCGINEGGPAHVYFPGNGGLLYAVAMMAAGWDGGPEVPAPGFPNDGSWVVKYEGLKKAQ